MPSIEFNDEDFNFLQGRADVEGISVEEYVSQLVDRQRLIVKYQGAPKGERTDSRPQPHMEAPHRKWGM